MICRSVTQMILLSITFAGTARAQSDTLFRIVSLKDATGMELGRGYDILTGNPRGDCVDRTTTQDNSKLGPNEVTFRSTRIESSESLGKFFNVSASASAGWGTFSGGASASATSALTVSRYNLTYAVDAEVNRKGDSIRDASLKSRLTNLIKSGEAEKLARFHDVCGDGYIGELQFGGRFQAVIQIETTSQSDTEQTAASVNASFGAGAGAASFAQSIKRTAETHAVRIWSFQKGGSGSIPLSPQELQNRVAALPDLVKASPSPIGAAIFSYVTVLDDVSLPVEDFKTREQALVQLSQVMQRARDQEADAQYILDHPSEFNSNPSDLPKLAMELSQLRQFEGSVTKAAQACIAAAGQCTISDVSVPSPIARPARR